MSDSTPASHLAARFSVIGAFTCLFANGITTRLVWSLGADRYGWLGYLVSVLTLALVLTGIGLAIVGLIGGRRRQSTDTQGVALIGLLLNLGITGLMIYGLWVIRTADPRG